MHFPNTANSLAATLALNTLHSISGPAIPSKGCHARLPPGLTPGGRTQNYTLNSPLGGGNRNYLVHLPPHYSPQNNKPSPLILVLHAFSQDPHSIESQSRLSEATTNTKYITVYPQGINNVWLGDPGAPNASVVDDRPFINDMLDELETTLCIDTARIYTTGFSNGGGLSGLLACYPATSRRIAAFSGVSAAYYTKQSLGYSLFEGGEQGGCQPGGNRPRRLPFLDIHGDADMVIAYSGDNSAFDVDQNGVPDPDTLAVPTWLADWAERNGCPSSSPSLETQEEEEELSVEAYLETGVTLNASTWLQGRTVQRSSWSCGGWSDVVVGYYVKGLGHGWPSTVPLDEQYEAFRLGPFKWNASAVLMDWFSRWTLPAEKKENM